MVERMFSAGEIIEACYHGLLRRAPDEAGRLSHTRELLQGSIAGTLRTFAESGEARRFVGNGPDVQINWRADMAVDLACTRAERNRLWAEVEAAWEHLGTTDPFWSVLSDDRYRGRELPADRLADFYASGTGDLDYFNAFLGRAGVRLPARAVVAEYGCGLGRVTAPLARQFAAVRAFDISLPHLQAAERHLAGQGLANTEFVHVGSRRDLARLRGVDVFFSMIVLQHSPPPVIVDILAQAFAGLNRGGIAFFQVPTYADGYGFKTADYLAAGEARREMEMHFVPQAAIFALAAEADLVPLEVRADHCVGNYDRYLSHTFLLRKR